VAATNIRGALAAACAALGVAGSGARAIEIDSALLYYGEPDRVKVAEGVLEMRGTTAAEHTWRLKGVFDALTGASANGALPSHQVQSFTSPSGGTAYTAPAGRTPLDTTFRDNRFALDGSYGLPQGRWTRWNLGASFSKESDYLASGLNLSFTRDLNQRNTSLTVALSGSFELSSPQGGVPIPFATMPPPSEREDDEGDDDGEREGDDDDLPPGRAGESDHKLVSDLLLGVTQVLDRSTIVQLNYTIGSSNGYLDDPYKLLSRIDTAGATLDYRYESRPDQRLRQNLFGQLKRHLFGGVLSGSYRYYWDDWGVHAHTVDGSYRWNISDTLYLRPRFRFHHQSAADFYRRELLADEPLPVHASADYRVGELSAYTSGAKIGWRVADEQEVSLRVEYYYQDVTTPDEPIPISLNSFDLTPAVDAWIVQLSYSTAFDLGSLWRW
jgi:hypothetical protein